MATSTPVPAFPSGKSLQEVPAHVDERAGPPVFGEFSDERFRLLD